MKYLLVVITLVLFFSCSNSQSTSNVDYSKGICECLDKLNKTGDVEHNFPNCFQLSLDRHKSAIIKEAINKYGDTSLKALTKVMDSIEVDVSIDLISSCKAFFEFTDSLKHQQYKNLNKDSLKNIISKLDAIDTSKRDQKYYTYTSTLYFQLGAYDKASENVEKVLAQDSTNVTALFIKASIMDMEKNYQDAIILYDKVAELSHRKGMYIYSAIAKRKKSGL